MMDPAAVVGLCAVLAARQPPVSLPAGLSCSAAPIASVSSSPPNIIVLIEALRPQSARDGVARVAYAEAGNQGDSGLAAVVYTILNRLRDGRWGSNIDDVLNARGQFEPVLRAGGDWRNLAPVSVAAQARIDTILNLTLEGRLPDLTRGARFFQNPAIVSGRAREGEVAAKLVNFGGVAPSATIGAHSFYLEAGRGGKTKSSSRATVNRQGSVTIFVGSSNRDPYSAANAAVSGLRGGAAAKVAGDPGAAIFVDRDGVVRDGFR